MFDSDIIVIDFETTGLSPAAGDRATEIAALRVRDGRVINEYVSLINAGVRVPSFITQHTGITQRMVDTAPDAKRVFRQLEEFIGGGTIAAHRASFDLSFLESEFLIAGLKRLPEQCICTLRLGRRLAPGLANFKL